MSTKKLFSHRDKLQSIKPETPAQKRARAENWARLQLKNIQCQSEKLYLDGFIGVNEFRAIYQSASMAEDRIKETQKARKGSKS